MAIRSDFANPRLKDFTHGQRLFGVNQNRLSPKFSFLYHVFFSINSAATETMYKPTSDHLKEVGLLVKSVDLPKFEIESKDLNAYNQHITVQTGIKYLPINIELHDDSANVVRNFWEDYMTFHYGDAYQNITKAVQLRENRYKNRDNQKWGYAPRQNVPYLQSVKIYSMSMDRYSLYTLVNPTIVNWTHGKHAAGQNEFIGHTMTLKYEYVTYEDGSAMRFLDEAYVPQPQLDGLDGIHYDQDTSELTKKWAISRGNQRSPVERVSRGDPRINLDWVDPDGEVGSLDRQYGATPRPPSSSTLGSRLRASIARAGQSVINSAIIKAENSVRNTKIGSTYVNSILQPALQNTVSRSAAGLSNSLFPSPRKD
jgi:hypothetical protein